MEMIYALVREYRTYPDMDYICDDEHWSDTLYYDQYEAVRSAKKHAESETPKADGQTFCTYRVDAYIGEDNIYHRVCSMNWEELEGELE